MGKKKRKIRTPWSILTIGRQANTKRRRKPGKLTLSRSKRSSSKSVPRRGRWQDWLKR